MTNVSETEVLKANRTYRSRMFEMIFSSKKELLELYNAMNGTHYEDPELLEINTLKNAIYMSMHNDISFIIDSRLALYEHQSTYSPNLPLRFLLYIADLYSALTKDENLYGTKAVRLPTPKFVVFYNGRKELPDIQELKLSDVFTILEDDPVLELKVILININPGHNSTLLNTCKTLKEYTEYTARVRTYANLLPLDEAVEKAIAECIQEGILSDFLTKNKAEAKKMSIYEYDEERHMRQTREEGREEGLEQGIRALIEACHEFGLSKDMVFPKLIEKFQLSQQAAQEYMQAYWKE